MRQAPEMRRSDHAPRALRLLRRWAGVAGLALVLLLGAGCTSSPSALGDGGNSAAPERVAADASAGPLVELAPLPSLPQAPPLDPSARPRTPLGALRAQFFPRWSPGFDRAFPPVECGSAWPLDAVAVPTEAVSIARYGDVGALAGLAVMRYEHLVAAVFARPEVMGQLCLAVAAADPERAELLDALVSLLDEHADTGAAMAGPAAGEAPDAGAGPGDGEGPDAGDGASDGDGADAGEGPDALGGASAAARSASDAALLPVEEVTVVAVGPFAALAVACAAGDGLGAADSPARLGAYRLSVVHGVEDQVPDVSYRVSQVTQHSAADCGADLAGWITQWERQVQAWQAEGQVWAPLGATVSAAGLCERPPELGPNECPHDWPAPTRTPPLVVAVQNNRSS